jgi:hypothetical protein
MDLSAYHKKYAARSDDVIRQHAAVKEMELSRIFKETGYKTNVRQARVAILGSGDKRFVRYHKSMLQSLLRREVQLLTFDISVDHLAGAEGVLQHDVTIPLPNAPYDIAYSHVLLKFIHTDRQWLALKNSYDALREPGMAIHVLSKEEIEAGAGELPEGFFGVPLDRWKKQLKKEKIKFKEIPLKIEGLLPHPIEAHALVLIKS